MSTKTTVLSLILALIVGVAVGRFSLPSKVVETKDLHEVDNSVTNKNLDKTDHSTITITEHKNLDGTVTKTTQIQKNIDTDLQSTKTAQTTKDEHDTKTVTYDVRTITIAGIATAKPLSGLHPSLTYGGEILYRILGPVQVGALGTTDGTMGIVLGLSF